MKKTPVIVSMPELKEILGRYLDADSSINYAVKVLGHPGIGKSDAVRQTAREKNFLFLDTRLAFKENIDLGSTAYSRRTQETGIRCFGKNRIEVHAETKALG